MWWILAIVFLPAITLLYVTYLMFKALMIIAIALFEAIFK